ncbi:MAG: hypothetical protein A2256_00530 [Candidatus Staskawiczbacteria bacterium RIFOXYA2_FULL_32_7]|nr:MAG: hypothetical protein A2256_00530 [Candidatus Staskawiczbacteria bacterium RIFOXYA2_FULL_32_7]
MSGKIQSFVPPEAFDVDIVPGPNGPEEMAKTKLFENPKPLSTKTANERIINLNTNFIYIIKNLQLKIITLCYYLYNTPPRWVLTRAVYPQQTKNPRSIRIFHFFILTTL